MADAWAEGLGFARVLCGANGHAALPSHEDLVQEAFRRLRVREGDSPPAGKLLCCAIRRAWTDALRRELGRHGERIVDERAEQCHKAARADRLQRQGVDR